MHKSFKQWATWSIAIFIVWAIVFLIRWRLKGSPDLRDLAILFAGYFIGWLSATIKFILIINKNY